MGHYLYWGHDVRIMTKISLLKGDHAVRSMVVVVFQLFEHLTNENSLMPMVGREYTLFVVCGGLFWYPYNSDRHV